MAEHGAFGRAGGPAGILQDGDVLEGIDLGGRERTVIVEQLRFRNEFVANRTVFDICQVTALQNAKSDPFGCRQEFDKGGNDDLFEHIQLN